MSSTGLDDAALVEVGPRPGDGRGAHRRPRRRRRRRAGGSRRRAPWASGPARGSRSRRRRRPGGSRGCRSPRSPARTRPPPSPPAGSPPDARAARTRPSRGTAGRCRRAVRGTGRPHPSPPRICSAVSASGLSGSWGPITTTRYGSPRARAASITSRCPFSATRRPTVPTTTWPGAAPSSARALGALVGIGRRSEAVEVDAVAEQRRATRRVQTPADEQRQILGVLDQLGVGEAGGDALEDEHDGASEAAAVAEVEAVVRVDHDRDTGEPGDDPAVDARLGVVGVDDVDPLATAGSATDRSRPARRRARPNRVSTTAARRGGRRHARAPRPRVPGR